MRLVPYSAAMDEIRALDVLSSDAGVWDADVEVRPSPDVPVQRSLGTMRSRMCGPWLVSDFKNETSGFEGHGVYGWDAVAGKYVGTWVDPMRRSLVVMEGTWDPERCAMTYVGEIKRPDGSRLRWREVTERPEADVRVFRSFVPMPPHGEDGGGEYEVMTVRYVRKSVPRE
jgi:hypothetical protein